MSTNPVGWFEIHVQDMPRALAFYQAVLGKPLTRMESGPEMDYWFFGHEMTAAGSGGALCRMEGAQSGPGGTLVYFSCADCAVEQARVEAAGGWVFKSKFPIGEHGHISLVFDTEGNMIGLHSMA